MSDKDLSKFNIESLFNRNNSNTSKPNYTGRLDLNSLFPPNKDKEYNFDANILLDENRKKKEKLKKEYNRIFKKCCEIVIMSNKLGKTDIYYELPKYSETPGYSCKDCITFIKEKFEQQKIQVKQEGNRSIHVIWDDLLRS